MKCGQRAALIFCVVVWGWAGGAVGATTLPERPSSSGEARLAVPHFNLADLMSEDEFADTEFIVLSQQESLNTQDHALNKDAASAGTELFEVHSHGSSSLAADSASQGNGVVCETVCRPRSSSINPASELAATPPSSRASFIETGSDSNPELRMTQDHLRHVIDDMQRQHAVQLNELAIVFNRTICESTGGGWDAERAVCAPFMRPSALAVSSCDGNGVFEACMGNFVDADGVTHYDGGSGDYVPCNPFQALALSHLQKSSVPKQTYFWLWAGGRSDQVESAAFKQDIGHNPVEGLDRCAEAERIGMFHDWDGSHVDSWSCLSCEHEFPVLCCRR